MLNDIDAALADLSRAEQAVAHWVLAHPRQAIGATLADVAAATGTSEPTVVRFCRSIGLDGFRDFKMRLAGALSRPGSVVHKNVGPDDSVEEAVTKVLDQSIQALHALHSRLPELPFAAATDRLVGARQIVFAGLGASGQVARDAQQKFFRLGVPCSVAVDTPTLVQLAAIADPADVIVIISATGRWPATLRAVDTARERGVTVIALTAPDSPLAATASLLFDCQINEDTSVFTPMSSRLEQLAILDALQVTLALSLGSAAEDRLRATKKALLNL